MRLYAQTTRLIVRSVTNSDQFVRICEDTRADCGADLNTGGQCRRDNLNCRGYQNTVTVVHYNPHGHGSTRYISTSTGRIPVSEENAPPITVAGMSLTQASMEFGFVDAYWNLYFPGRDESGIPATEHNYSVTPLFELWNQWRDDRLVKGGMHALTSAIVGRRHNDQRLTNDSLQAYSKVLRDVNQSLQHSDRHKRDSVLAACKFLATYEAQTGAGYNWEIHTLGTQQLLIVRGPYKHTRGMAHTLFLDARLQATMVALKRRERTPLANPDWQQIPWTYHPKDLLQKLLDVMIQLPAILAEFDAIKAAQGTSTDTVKRRRRFFERCERLHDEAESWLHELEAGIGTHLFVDFKDGIPLESLLKYFSQAYTMSLYWTFCIGLHGNIRLAFRDIPVLDSAITPNDIYTWCNPEPYAYRIANSVGYFFRPDAGTFPAMIFTYHLGVAMNYFAYTYHTSHPEYVRLFQVLKYGKAAQISGKLMQSFEDSPDTSKVFQ